MAVTNIPTPDNDVLQTWLKGTRDKKLVYSTKERKWKIVQAGKVARDDVTYESFQQGEKSFESVKGDGTPQEISVDWAKKRYESATNPLKKYIDEYGLSVKVEKDGTAYLADKQNKPYYLYFTSDGTLKIDFDYDKVKKAALDDLKKTGQLNTLFDELYKRKLIDKETYDLKSTTTNQFNQALKFFINEYSKSVIELNEPYKTPQNFFEFMLGIAGEPGGGEENLPRREFQDISKEQLNAFIDGIYLETIGRKPTDEQRTAKMKELNKIVKAGIVTTTRKVGGELQTRSKGGFDEQQEALKLQEQLKTENPLEYERRQAFDFIDQLQKIMSGGM